MKINEKFYKIISRIFDPIILGSVCFMIVINRFNIGLVHSIIIFILLVVIPVTYFLLNIVKGSMDIDLTKRETRIPLFTLVLVGGTISSILFKVWGYKLIFDLSLMLLGLIGVLIFITLHWKISVHALINTLFFGFLGFIYTPIFFAFIPIIVPIVGYSRVKLHKHTPKQVIGGAILGILFLILLMFVLP